MVESNIASIVKIIESIDAMLKIAEKNPIAFNIESLRKSRENAVRQLEASKTFYRNAMKVEANIEKHDDASQLKKYKS
nr:hypothetical protein [Candidatus Sigynarchaeota archaeon]